MVLQRIELEGKAGSSPFWAFVSLIALMGKHGFAVKLHLLEKWSPDDLGVFAPRTTTPISPFSRA
jgi:hypothetical protein